MAFDRDYPRKRVGELRPSQAIFTFGVGALVDLPNLSVMVMGLEDWPERPESEIGEPRLLDAVSERLGWSVKKLLSPPVAPDTTSTFDVQSLEGIPAASFPRWLVCPYCRVMAPIQSEGGLFELKHDLWRPDRTGYIHANCHKQGKPPTALPVRFLVGCEAGHMDDFPWIEFVHGGPTECKSILSLRELGVSGEAADVQVECKSCGKKRRMAQAFGFKGEKNLAECSGTCSGRRPHLRDYETDGCKLPKIGLLLGASNSWFPVMLSAISLPSADGELSRLVEANWTDAEDVPSVEGVKLLKKLVPDLGGYSDAAIWKEIERAKAGSGNGNDDPSDLKGPEWTVLSRCDPAKNTENFRLTEEAPPKRYAHLFEKVVKVERMREVRALIGFSRIDPPEDGSGDGEESRTAPLSRSKKPWVPGLEVRGEGIFLQFREKAISKWLGRCGARESEFHEAHRKWRSARQLDPEKGFPGLKFVLLHGFSHLLMRQFALECGYSAASVRERIYSDAFGKSESMSGVLIYTAAPDSEGTLGGLVGLGRPEVLEHHLDQALRSAELCASDPLCSEHEVGDDDMSLHGAACHACLLAPETSCECGNRYLDRALLVATYTRPDWAFFESPK